MLRISNVRVKLNQNNYKELLSSKLNIPKREIKSVKLVKQSIDARRGTVVYNCSFDFEVINEDKVLRIPNVTQVEPYVYEYLPSNNLSTTVVGFGPAGIFAAYILANAGNKVTVLERGEKIEQRVKDVEAFFNEGKFNPKSNIAFGEGGAGTFSDGKLQTSNKNIRLRYILETFVKYGAPEDILYLAKPHIGTDYLRKVIVNLRKDLEAKGVEFHFGTQMTDYEYDGKYHIHATHKGEEMTFESDCLVLALGHSAKDTIEMLYKKGLNIEQKPFAMGVRLEQKQEIVNTIQYGKNYPKQLKAAPFQIAVHTSNDRSVYTFCMCPGGIVVPSNDTKNHICVNGMSYYARDLENANSAILVNVKTEDFPNDHPLSGFDLQEELEVKAFNISKDYKAPVQLVKDFILNKPSTSLGNVIPSYPLGYQLCNLREIFPEFMNNALAEGFQLMNKKMKGLIDDSAVITGVETRSSSPCRIVRNKDYMASNHLYPIGEGAGYAGGIMSAAVDGILCAEAILKDEL